MLQSILNQKFQTTIPLEVRRALNLRPRQRLAYELRADGSAIIRAASELDVLFGSVKIKRPIATIQEEKRAARSAFARGASIEEPR